MSIYSANVCHSVTLTETVGCRNGVDSHNRARGGPEPQPKRVTFPRSLVRSLALDRRMVTLVPFDEVLVHCRALPS